MRLNSATAKAEFPTIRRSADARLLWPALVGAPKPNSLMAAVRCAGVNATPVLAISASTNCAGVCVMGNVTSNCGSDTKSARKACLLPSSSSLFLSLILLAA